MSDYTESRDQITAAAKQQAIGFALHAVTQIGIWAWNKYAAPALVVHGFPAIALPVPPAPGAAGFSPATGA